MQSDWKCRLNCFGRVEHKNTGECDKHCTVMNVVATRQGTCKEDMNSEKMWLCCGYTPYNCVIYGILED